MIEDNTSLFGINNEFNKEIINFIIYCKFRKIINEGSITCVYNIEYFGIKNNINKLLNLAESEVYKYQNKFNILIENGPFNN